MKHRILIVDDDLHIREVIRVALKKADMTISEARDGKEALARFANERPDLVVLDIGMPEFDGLDVCREIRKSSDVPILFLSARDEEIDRILGLEIGGDDYVTKPFSPRELVARIKVILRRLRKPDEREPILHIDESTRAIRIRSRLLELTATEFNLLSAMARRPGTVFSRAQLLDLADRDSLDVTDRAVDTHIKNLRQKLARLLPDTDIIHSVYGLGYRVELP